MRRRDLLAALFWPRRRQTMLGGTFIQFWRQHREWPAERWDQLFDAFAALKLREVVVQWSAWGEEDYVDLMEGVVRRARERRMGVWLGLWHDPAYWEKPDLERIRTKSVGLARALHARFRRSPAFRGWYLPEEIDEGTWATPDRRGALKEHFRETASQLHGRVAVSGFTNGQTPPGELAAFWKDLLRGARVRELWFQDGIGAGKLSLETWAPRLEALRHAGIPVRVVVELFERISENPFQARTAALERVQQQLEIAGKLTKLKPLGFSVPDYWWSGAGEVAGQRFEDYRRALRIIK